ncbi:MAG TPA: ABC transporter substrate-binding protein, partial [Chloroflexota bacterium]|nr:ABC transporter substrate-binding protein [Chloroflexota bacterium]
MIARLCFQRMSKIPAALLLCLSFAACGGAAPSQPAAASPAPASAAKPSAAASQPAAQASKPAAAAAGASQAADAGAPIKIGLVVPLTGAQSPAGKDNLDGMNLYLGSVNNTIAGRKIELVSGDTTGQADVALTKAKQLVENDHVNVLMGLTLTPECYAIGGYVQQAHVPTIISDNCGAQGLTTDPKVASPYIVRTTFSSFMTD